MNDRLRSWNDLLMPFCYQNEKVFAVSDLFGTLFLARHGAVEAAKEKRFLGQMDAPLSPEGFDQARRLAHCLESIALTQIWSSDLRRAAQTADIICQERRIDLKTASSLREINLGKWEGAGMEDTRLKYPELWEARGREIDTFRPPEGESFTDLQLRVVPGILRIVGSVSGNILIVTHAGVIRVLLCHILQIPLRFLFRFHLDYCGVTLIQDVETIPRILAINRIPNGSFVPH